MTHGYSSNRNRALFVVLICRIYDAPLVGHQSCHVSETLEPTFSGVSMTIFASSEAHQLSLSYFVIYCNMAYSFHFRQQEYSAKMK